MAKENQVNTPPAQANQHEPATPDRRLSQLEISVFVTGLLCLFVFGVVFLNNQLVQNHTNQMTSRAQSVADWIAASHKVRVRNGGLVPERCRRIRNPLSFCFKDMVAPGQPFEGLVNIYAADQTSAPAFAFVAVPHLGKSLESCRFLPSPVFISAPGQSGKVRPENWTGVIVVQPATLLQDLSSTVNSLSVGYCDRQQSLVWVEPTVSF